MVNAGIHILILFYFILFYFIFFFFFQGFHSSAVQSRLHMSLIHAHIYEYGFESRDFVVLSDCSVVYCLLCVLGKESCHYPLVDNFAYYTTKTAERKL